MNILWLCNGPIPRASNIFDLSESPKEGWLISVANELERKKDINLSVMFINQEVHAGINYKQDADILFVGVNWSSENEREKIDTIKTIILRLNPDIIHIWGTESEHSYYMSVAIKEMNMSSKLVVSIQGLLSMYTYHYMTGLPGRTQIIPTIRDIIRRDTLAKQKRLFYKRGEIEKKTLKNVRNVIGRTFWDKACVELINPDAKYYFNNETLRNSFYINNWNIDNCVRHRIFVSQAQYPIKGFHFLVEAISLLKEKYPDVSVVIGGSDNTFKKGILITAYGKYIDFLIKKYGLEQNIKYIGMLSEKEMLAEYLNAEVFVSSSSIENSPNSVGEAMLLGMPVVSSNVGGVADMLLHNREGFLYQSDAPYLLAYYIKKFFDNDTLKIEMGNNARVHALNTHNRDENVKKLIEIYTEIKK